MKHDLISRQSGVIGELTLQLDSPIADEQWDAITDVNFEHTHNIWFHTKSGKDVEFIKVIRCKDCKYQEKFFQKDGRRKDGGYYIYGCYLAEGYSHVCLDDDYCSRAERKEGKHETD